MRRAVGIVWAVLVGAAAGCGGGGATVSGKVRYKGKPVVSGSVIVVNPDGTARTGVIYPDGTYAVAGVSRGVVRVGVLSPDPAHARSILKTGSAAKGHPTPGKASHAHTRPGTGGWYPLPPALGDPDKSGQAFEVSSSRVAHDIELN